jgi:hypothetical protein
MVVIVEAILENLSARAGSPIFSNKLPPLVDGLFFCPIPRFLRMVIAHDPASTGSLLHPGKTGSDGFREPG